MPIKIGDVVMPNRIHRQIAAAAERGARFLDANAGKWFNRIKTTQLEMKDSCNCIYGQLNKYDLIDEIRQGRAKAPRGISRDTAFESLGYCIPDGVSAWAYDENDIEGNAREAVWVALQEEWLRQIKLRRDAAKAAA